MISDGKSIVKIEPNFIFRGAVCGVNKLSVSKKVTQEFGEFISDVFAGKICAALKERARNNLNVWHLIFGSSCDFFQSQNPQNRATIPRVLLNQKIET